MAWVISFRDRRLRTRYMIRRDSCRDCYCCCCRCYSYLTATAIVLGYQHIAVVNRCAQVKQILKVCPPMRDSSPLSRCTDPLLHDLHPNMD